MPETGVGSIGEVIFARIAPDEDLLGAIRAVCRQHNIRTGVVLSITGALSEAHISFFEPQNEPSDEPRGPSHLRYSGPMEVSGHGVLGVGEEDEPYIHIHLTMMTPNGEAVCGHLHDGGTMVRSLIPKSHFTIAIASVTGVEVREMWDVDAKRIFPEALAAVKGAPYHELVQVDGAGDVTT